jgi:DNA-binding IclR family transcriptional regulator
MPRPSEQPAILAKTAAKALDVLECLALAETPLNAQAVAARCQLSRPTAYRLLRTLMERGFVEVVGEGRYRLGTKILRLSRYVLDRLELPSLAKPILRALREKTGEMSLAAILEKDSLFYIAKYETTHAVRMASRVGTSGPLHATALGKAILAFLPEEERTSLLKHLQLARIGPKTITNRARLQEHLERVRRMGFAIEDEENEPEIRSIAAPVFNHMGEVIGAVGTSGPAYRLEIEHLEGMAVAVMEAAAQVSAALGHAGQIPSQPSVSSKAGRAGVTGVGRRRRSS